MATRYVFNPITKKLERRFEGEVPIDQLELREQSVDPGDPDEGRAVLWMSDGTDSGEAGDILMKVTDAGSTKTITLIDFSIMS